MRTIGYGVLFLAVFLFGVVGGHYIGMNYRLHLMQMEASLLDHTLNLWSMSKLRPEEGKNLPSYPAALYELGDIPYPSEEWPSRILSMGAPLYVHRSRFHYQTKTNADGSMAYRLEVVLPNGYNFKSPGSTF